MSRSDLLIAFNPESEFNCSRCKWTGRELVCFCRNCQRYMHPSCAGVETETLYSTDRRKRVVLPVSEKLPKSCRDCSRKMKEIGRTNQLAAITRFLQLGTGHPHKLEEGHDDRMVHRHIPGHELRPKDNGTINRCSGCKMKSFGLHYACVNASCSFCLHEECKAPRKFTRHRFFPDLTFAFSCLHNTSDRSIFCNACGMIVNGYYYHSLDGKNNLHLYCMNLPKKIICGDSGVEMKLRPQSTSKCVYYNERSVKMGNKSSNHVWSYKAVTEIYHLCIR